MIAVEVKGIERLRRSRQSIPKLGRSLVQRGEDTCGSIGGESGEREGMRLRSRAGFVVGFVFMLDNWGEFALSGRI